MMKSEFKIQKDKSWVTSGNMGTWSRRVKYTTDKAVTNIVKSFKQQGVATVVIETEDAFLITA